MVLDLAAPEKEETVPYLSILGARILLGSGGRRKDQYHKARQKNAECKELMYFTASHPVNILARIPWRPVLFGDASKHVSASPSHPQASQCWKIWLRSLPLSL